MSKAAKAEAQKHISECRNLLAQGAGPTAAAKAQPDTKEGKEKAAKKACLTGDAVGGVAILTDLFIETADPTYLFNQGRCFEQNRRYEDAIGRFREYLVKAKNLRPEDKEDTKKHIADCESYVRDKGGEPAKHEPRKVKDESSGPGASQAVDEAHPAGVKALATGQDSARTGVGLRVAGLVLAGVGGAALVTGMVLNLKANQLSKDVEADWDPSVESSRKTYQTAGWVAYGGGAASLAAGALFYYLGWRARESGETVAFVPTVTPTMAGASFVGAF